PPRNGVLAGSSCGSQEQSSVGVDASIDREVSRSSHKDGGVDLIGEAPVDRCGHRLDIPHRHEPAVLPTGENLGGATRAIRGYHGSAASHRLDERARQALPHGGEREQAGTRHVPERVVDEAGKLENVADLQLASETEESVSLCPLAEDDESHLSSTSHLRDGPEERRVVLLPPEPAHAEDDG